MTTKRINKPRRIIHDVEELPVLCDAAEAGLLLRLTPETVARMARPFAGTTWWPTWTTCSPRGWHSDQEKENPLQPVARWSGRWWRPWVWGTPI